VHATPDLFVDAGGWIALANSDDQYHAIAASGYPDFLRRYRRLLTTTLVVAESYVALRLGLGHRAAVRFLDILEASPRIHRVPVGLALEQSAERILRQYSEQRFSYIDAVSFAVMQARGLTVAFAFDQHFSTFGFVCVPAR
jgi:predicted nucleic acid-binding protein